MSDIFGNPTIAATPSALGAVYNPSNPALALFTTQSENPTDASLGLFSNSGFGNLNFSGIANDNTNSGYMYASNDPTLLGGMVNPSTWQNCGLSLSCYGQAFVRGANRLAGGAVGQSVSQSDSQGLLGGLLARGGFILIGVVLIIGAFLLVKNREVIIQAVKKVPNVAHV